MKCLSADSRAPMISCGARAALCIHTHTVPTYTRCFEIRARRCGKTRGWREYMELLGLYKAHEYLLQRKGAVIVCSYRCNIFL